MADVRVAPIKLWMNVFQFKEPCAAAKIKAPTTPTDAASVAVAHPKYIEPITAMTREITGSRNRLSYSICLKGMASEGSGLWSFFT